MALPKAETEEKHSEKKYDRDPFPLEIEQDNEKYHKIKQCKEVLANVEEIRKLHLDACLFDAKQKSDELLDYLKYNETEYYECYKEHPRRKLIYEHLEETNKMLDFMTHDLEWALYKDDGKWKTEWMTSEKSQFLSFRLTGTANIPLFNIVAVIYEMDLYTNWMPLCKEAKSLGSLSLMCKAGYNRIGLFWPIQDRECIIRGYGVDDLQNGKVLIYFDSRESDPDIDIPPCPKGRCRVDIFLGGMFFERLTDNETKITTVWNSDPKILAPASVVDWFAGTFASNILNEIVKCAKFDEDSEYAKRIRENDEFYGKMKRRMEECKSLQELQKEKANDNNNNENDINTSEIADKIASKLKLTQNDENDDDDKKEPQNDASNQD